MDAVLILLSLFCEFYNARYDFCLVDEYDGWEVYECPNCHRQKSYKVEFGVVQLTGESYRPRMERKP